MLFQAICSKINEHFYEQENDIGKQIVEQKDEQRDESKDDNETNDKKDKSKKVYKFPDLELGFGPIIDVESNINDKLFSQSFLDNCLSSVNYLTSPDKIGLNMNFSFMFEPEKYLKQQKYSKQEPKQKPEKNDTKSDKTDSYIIDI